MSDCGPGNECDRQGVDNSCGGKSLEFACGERALDLQSVLSGHQRTIGFHHNDDADF